MKYVSLLMGNLVDARCGETADAPSEEDFIAYGQNLMALDTGVLARGFGLTDPQDGTTVTKASKDAEPVITAEPYA